MDRIELMGMEFFGRHGCLPEKREKGQTFFVDVKLYLDTHPRYQEALDFFYEYNKKRNQLLKEYAKYYGPLTVDTAVPSCSDRWNWINEPWPWQEGGC